MSGVLKMSGYSDRNNNYNASETFWLIEGDLRKQYDLIKK